MSYTRLRTLDISVPATGRYRNPVGNWVTVNRSGSGLVTTSDVVGNRRGINPFDSESYGCQHVLLHGYIPGTASYGYTYEAVPTTAGSSGGASHSLTATLTASQISALALEAVAKSNVNRPGVSLPTFVGELKDLPWKTLTRLPWESKLADLPRLVRSYGREHLLRTKQYSFGTSFPKDLANKHLAYRFGLFPMVSDFTKLTQFALGVEKRLEYIRRLAEGQRIHKSVTLDGDQNQIYDPEQTLWSTGATIKSGRLTRTTTQKTWASVEWELDPSIKPFIPLSTTEGQREMAIRSYLGLTPQSLGLTAWELLPWSWLIDWFVGVGNLLEACQNSIPVKSSRVCIMRKTETHQLGQPYVSSAHKGVMLTGRWHRWRITKLRYPKETLTPFTVTFVPFLGAERLSILGSLAIQRRR